MKRKKILYIGNQLSTSNKVTVTSIETLGRFLKNEGYTIKRASHFKNKLLRLFHMMLTSFFTVGSRDIVLIDTYSTQNFWFAVVVGFICRMRKVPYIPILRGGDLPNRLKKSAKASRNLFGNAKLNVAPSTYLYEIFQQAGFTNIVQIPNTLELKKYKFRRRHILQPKLLWVRSFAEIYNPLLALKILESLLESYPNAELCMVGPEKDASFTQCKSYASERNLPVTFKGKLSKEAWRELAAHYDIFINTTNFDNTPVSVLEAMALGLPVVTTEVGGIPYLLKNEEDAILVQPNDASVFVHAVNRLLENPILAEKLSRQGRKMVEAFDWEVVKEQWIDLLGE